MRCRPWPTRRRHLVRKIIAGTVAVIVLFWGIGTYRDLEGLIGVYGETRCRNLVTQTVLDCFSLMKNNEKLSAFTEVDNQKILQVNHEHIIHLQTEYGRELSRRLDVLEEQIHYVPLGTVLENAFLIGHGPKLAIRYVPIGAAEVKIDSLMTDAGVNQILYKMFVTVTVDMTVLVPSGSRRIRCQQEILLEEALICGEVPLFYGG